MKNLLFCEILLVPALALMSGCSTTTKAPDVTGEVRKALDQPNFKDVSVSQDRDKGVVTLGGHVTSDADKAQAEALAKPIAGSQVLANEIAVYPVGAASPAKTINSDLDKGIEKNLDAELVKRNLDHDVKYNVTNSVVTLKGNVDSEKKRTDAERIAAAVPNVNQVVNELEVKNRKATSQY